MSTYILEKLDTKDEKAEEAIVLEENDKLETEAENACVDTIKNDSSENVQEDSVEIKHVDEKEKSRMKQKQNKL